MVNIFTPSLREQAASVLGLSTHQSYEYTLGQLGFLVVKKQPALAEEISRELARRNVR
jgi:hypothetical protein